MLRNALAVDHPGRHEKGGQDHAALTDQRETEIEQATIDVHRQHTTKTDQAPQAFGPGQAVVTVYEVRQQHAEKRNRAVEHRTFHSSGMGQPHVEKNEHDRGLQQPQRRDFGPILRFQGDDVLVGFAEFDQAGNVNVHRFNGKIAGTGGFIEISQNSRKVVFCGTLTAGGLKVSFADGKLKIDNEGKFRKLIAQVPEVTFNGTDAVRRGQEVVFVTERAVFRLTPQGIELCEAAPGIDIEHDILAHMGFRPKMASTIKVMDPRMFRPETMGIKNTWRGMA